MKYTIHGFLQSRLIELKLSERDALILRYFIDFRDTGKMTARVIDGSVYYWVHYDYFIEEFPILSYSGKQWTKNAIYRRLKRLVDCQVLTHQTVRCAGTFSYFGIGKAYCSLISSTQTPAPLTSPASDGTSPASDGTSPASDGTSPASERRSIHNIQPLYPSITSNNNNNNTPKTPRPKSAVAVAVAVEKEKNVSKEKDMTTAAFAAESINNALEKAERQERISPEIVMQICENNGVTPEEVIAAASALAQDKKGIQKVVGVLRGAKDATGKHVSSYFRDGLHLIAPAAPPAAALSNIEKVWHDVRLACRERLDAAEYARSIYAASARSFERGELILTAPAAAAKCCAAHEDLLKTAFAGLTGQHVEKITYNVR